MQFLPEEAINNPNALGDIFAEMHEAYQNRKVPMTEEQTRHSIMIMMSSPQTIEGMYQDLEGSFPIGGFIKRMGILPIKYDKKLLLWLAIIHMSSNIGGMILVGYYVQWWAYNHGPKVGKELSLETVTTNCFPFGVMNDEFIHEFWDKQKVKARPDNLVDHHTAAESFIPKEEIVS